MNILILILMMIRPQSPPITLVNNLPSVILLHFWSRFLIVCWSKQLAFCSFQSPSPIGLSNHFSQSILELFLIALQKLSRARFFFFKCQLRVIADGSDPAYNRAWSSWCGYHSFKVVPASNVSFASTTACDYSSKIS